MSALNPKALLFFLVFLPKFARPAARWPLGVRVAGAAMVVAGVVLLVGHFVRGFQCEPNGVLVA